MKIFGLLVIGGAVGLKFEDLTFDTLKSSFNQAVPKVFGNKNLDTAIIGNDYVPFFKWCDTNNDGSVALFESARCGSKVGYWFPSSVGWFDWATYATTISLDMTTIMMKYMNNIDRDSSMSLDQSEFAWNFAAMVHSSADGIFNVFDANKDGQLTGNEFDLWNEFSRRGIDVSLPKTGNHMKLFAECGMDKSATKDQITKYVSKMMVQFLIEYEDDNDVNIPEFSWTQIRASYNNHAAEVFENPTDLTATIFAEDSDAFFEWCDADGSGEVSLWESASCGAKTGFWQPEGHMTSWTDTFTYGTEIAYDFTTILLKYWKNIDQDGSNSLSKDEFRISYAKMALLAAHVGMDIFDSDSDGIIQGNDLKSFANLTQRAANVVLPKTGDKFNMVSKMHSQSGISNVADVHNLAKFNSRIMAAFLPEYENFHANMKIEL